MKVLPGHLTGRLAENLSGRLADDPGRPGFLDRGSATKQGLYSGH